MEHPAEREHHVRGAVAVQIADARAPRLGQRDRLAQLRFEWDAGIHRDERPAVLRAGPRKQDRPRGERGGGGRQGPGGHRQEQVLPAVAVVVKRRGEVEVAILVAEPPRPEAEDRLGGETRPRIQVRVERPSAKPDSTASSKPSPLTSRNATRPPPAGSPLLNPSHVPSCRRASDSWKTPATSQRSPPALSARGDKDRGYICYWLS
jgi:hypothetical protein